MRILFVTQSYPPHPEVGALRAENLVRAFLEAGHRVSLVTERVPGAEYPEADPSADLEIIPVGVGVPFVRRIQALTRWGGRQEPHTGPEPGRDAGSAGQQVTSSRPGFTRKAIVALLSAPDENQHIVVPFIRAGLRRIRAGIDLLYTSAPPFSTHLAGLALHRWGRVPWVVELRDPWIHPWTERVATRHRLSRGIDAFWERRVLRSADLLVSVTPAAGIFLGQRLPPAQQDRILVALNGIPDWGPVPASAERPGRSPFTILHAGSLYMNRDPTAFLEGVARFAEAAGLGPSDLQVQLIGRCREFNGVSVQGMVNRLGLDRYVRIEDWLPHDEVRARIQHADVLVLFAQQQPLQIPNKLYEYLAARAPILAFVDRDGESASILAQIGGTEAVFDASSDVVTTALGRLYQRRAAGRAPMSDAEREFRGRLATREQLRRLVSGLTSHFGLAGESRWVRSGAESPAPSHAPDPQREAAKSQQADS